MLNAVEGVRFLQSLPKAGPILYMTPVTANPRIEDILQGVLPEK